MKSLFKLKVHEFYLLRLEKVILKFIETQMVKGGKVHPNKENKVGKFALPHIKPSYNITGIRIVRCYFSGIDNQKYKRKEPRIKIHAYVAT